MFRGAICFPDRVKVRGWDHFDCQALFLLPDLAVSDRAGRNLFQKRGFALLQRARGLAWLGLPRLEGAH